MPAPKFILRLARIPEVINLLSAYPDGLSLDQLASQFDTDAQTLRQDLTAYLELDSWGWFEDVFHLPAIEFVADDDSPLAGSVGGTTVRMVPESTVGLGAEYFSAGDLSIIYTAGVALLDVEPDDEHLSGALQVIADTMYGEPTAVPRVGGWTERLRALQEAQASQRKARIVYSRAWAQGVSERVIEPLRLVQTKRGWEVDAGPVAEGNLRTYLLSNIRSVELLDETFDPPRLVDALLEKQRQTTSVEMTITQDSRWAARQFAEELTVLSEDEESVTLRLELLPPVAERVALVMMASGPSTTVYPGKFMVEATETINALLAHHQGS